MTPMKVISFNDSGKESQRTYNGGAVSTDLHRDLFYLD